MVKKVANLNEVQLRNIIKRIITEDYLSNVNTYSKPVAAWKMIRVAMEEIVNTMDETVRGRGGEQNITDEDVKRMLNNREIYTCCPRIIRKCSPQGLHSSFFCR